MNLYEPIPDGYRYDPTRRPAVPRRSAVRDSIAPQRAAFRPEPPRRAPLNTKLCRRCGVYSMTSATRCQDCGADFDRGVVRSAVGRASRE